MCVHSLDMSLLNTKDRPPFHEMIEINDEVSLMQRKQYTEKI